MADSRVWDRVRDLSRGGITSLDGSSGEDCEEEAEAEALALLTLVLLLRDSAGSFSLSMMEVREEPEEPEEPEVRLPSWLAVRDREGMA